MTVCPFGSRDSNTGACNNTAVPTVSVQGSVFLLRVPSSVPAGDMYVQVDRLCGGNTTGDCGVPLWVSANGCVEGACTPGALVPYYNDSAVSRVVFDAIGGVRVPFGACYGNGPVGSAACVYAFGIYPVCAPFPPPGPGGFTPPPPPGVGCAPALFRVTLSTPVGTQRVPQDCLANGQTCTLPEHDVISGYSRRYETYAGDSRHAVGVSLTATLCSGDPSSFAFYVCWLGGSCGALSTPSASNADVIARGNNAGIASVTLPPLSPAVLFTAVTASGKAGLAYPTFQLSLQGGPGPALSLDPLDPYTTVYRDATLTVINVQWKTPLLSRPSTGLPPSPAAGMVYFVWAFPVGITGQAQLSTPCGVRDAIDAARAAGPGFGGALFAENLAGTFVQLVGASAGTSYSVTVVAL